MLEDTQCIPNELAFWSDGSHRQALRIRARSASASSEGVSFFVPDFALSNPEPWLLGDEIPWPSFSDSPRPALLGRKEIATYSDFATTFADILQHIRSGDFQKVVPMVAEELEFIAALHLKHFPAALTPGPNQYSYAFEWEGEGFCGITPELLFEVKDGTLSTMALAGTGPSDGPSLLENPKERIEHQLVIEHIQHELKALGKISLGRTEERPYRRLKHLYTPIAVRLEQEVSFLELVRRLHPTAALGGWPRQSALAWLERQDFNRYRRRFGAPFGFTRAGGEMKCVVAIRGLQWMGSRAWLAAGCGVVEQSQAESEWRELKLKLSAIESNLGLSR